MKFRFAFVLSIALALLVAETGMAASDKTHDGHHSPDHAASDSGHAMPAPQRSEANYDIPAVTLLREDGSPASFPAELEDGRPVVLAFVFTSCTTICPILSHVLAGVQKQLGEKADRVRILSVTLDPEYDNPERLAAYARKLGAGPTWRHYTGRLDDVIAFEKAFKVYFGDKMNHLPVFFIRKAPGQSWVRLQGFIKPNQIIRELFPVE